MATEISFFENPLIPDVFSGVNQTTNLIPNLNITKPDSEVSITSTLTGAPACVTLSSNVLSFSASCLLGMNNFTVTFVDSVSSISATLTVSLQIKFSFVNAPS
jgi:hypothetical protein